MTITKEIASVGEGGRRCVSQRLFMVVTATVAWGVGTVGLCFFFLFSLFLTIFIWYLGVFVFCLFFLYRCHMFFFWFVLGVFLYRGKVVTLAPWLEAGEKMVGERS